MTVEPTFEETVESRLERARALAGEGRRDEAMTALLDAWRAHPAVELGELIDALGAAWRTPESPITRRGGLSAIVAWERALASAVPTSLPWLLEELAQVTSPGLMSPRVRALAERPPDPRVSTALVALVDALPHHGRMARGLWISVFQEIERIGDPRGRAALVRIDADVRAYRREPLRHTGRVVAQQLAAIAARVAALPPVPPLSARAAAIVDQLGAQPAPLPIAHVSTVAVGEEELLASIHASPDDDGPRLVYADWLTERGDARGELITLQCARAKSGGEPSRRERALLKDHERAWIGPLAPVVLRGGVRFARGFLAGFRFRADTVAASALVGHPAWSTVEEVDANPHVYVSQVTDWLAHPAASSLRVVYGLNDDALESLAKVVGGVRWHTVGSRSFAPLDEVLLKLARVREAGALPMLRAIDLTDLSRFEPRGVERVIDHPAGAGLDEVATRAPLGELGGVVRLVATRGPRRVILRSERWEREPRSGIDLTIDRGPPLTITAVYRGSTWAAGVLEPLVGALLLVEPALCARLTVDLAPALRKKPGVGEVLAPIARRFGDAFALA